ncbi:MAG: hypothetical protein M3457_09325 [Chloroflexota bacterium]|nr:hypothetical protein [Chloroflexota bacterium]
MSEITVFEAAGDAHVEGIALWLGEVFGGPKQYPEERGGYPHMVSRHVNRALTEEQRAHWADLMIATARDVLCRIRSQATNLQPSPIYRTGGGARTVRQTIEWRGAAMARFPLDCACFRDCCVSLSWRLPFRPHPVLPHRT